MIRVLLIFGTRPEAVKLSPLIRELNSRPEHFSTFVCVTGQHREMLDQILSTFQIRPSFDLNVMQPGQTLLQSTSRILAGLEPAFATAKPDVVIVQGDTTTTLCGALAAAYLRVPLAHVEAGLRTGDLSQPFPEEMNRVLTSRITTLHFAATEWAASNLRNEEIRESSIFVTGNTGVDAVLYLRDELESGRLQPPPPPPPDFGRKVILVTAHRRESFGEGMERICSALLQLASREDVQIVLPVHPNPNIRQLFNERLGSHARIILTEPLGYVQFVNLMRLSYLLITDSGGVQEEGPSLGKPILVLREKTERPEAVLAGTVQLVGTDTARIVSAATLLLDDPNAYQAMARRHNPYGDGQASHRIANILDQYFTGQGTPAQGSVKAG